MVPARIPSKLAQQAKRDQGLEQACRLLKRAALEDRHAEEASEWGEETEFGGDQQGELQALIGDDAPCEYCTCLCVNNRL